LALNGDDGKKRKQMQSDWQKKQLEAEVLQSVELWAITPTKGSLQGRVATGAVS
jgi:hypothetical protein